MLRGCCNKLVNITEPKVFDGVLMVVPVNHYTGKGNFRRAATQQQNLAEIYEIEIVDPKRALEAYDVRDLGTMCI